MSSGFLLGVTTSYPRVSATTLINARERHYLYIRAGALLLCISARERHRGVLGRLTPDTRVKTPWKALKSL